MYQDLGICAQMLLEGLPELSLTMSLEEEKAKFENRWEYVQSNLKTGKRRDLGGCLMMGISAGQIVPKEPVDFAERGFSLDVFVMEPNNTHVLRYCPGKDVCAIL